MKEELLREIDIAFEKSGKKDSWLYDTFQNLFRLNQLSHFQICEINWFPGAAHILNLIDQLHTIETSKEDFICISKLLNLDVNPELDKEVIANLVKSQKSWRAKSFELDTTKKLDLRKEKLQPLFEELRRFGYQTNSLPKQIEFKRWIVDAINESDNTNKVMVQSDKNEFICILDGVGTGLIEII